MLGAAFALAGVAGSATAGPNLLDLDGGGAHTAVIRHTDGTWWAHDALGPRTPLTLSMTRKPEWHWAASGDFDGNGKDDVLLRRTDGAWTYYPMDGGSVVEAGRGWANLTKRTDWRPVGVGDFNNDGRDDVLLRRADGAWLYYAMSGRRVIAGESGWANLPRALDWRVAGIGDFDGDGRDGVLLRHLGGAWRLYPMEGRRAIAERVANPDFTGEAAWRFVAVGDFNADERGDILLRHTSGRWRWQTSTGGAATSTHPALPRDWRWRLAAVGDVDGDGDDDMLLRHVDGRWRTHSALDGKALAGTPNMPNDLAWRIAAPPVHIPDPALRDAVRLALALSEEVPVTRRALSQLEALEANAGVGDIAGIGLATGLKDLEIRAGTRSHETPKHVVRDITELASLVQLTRLSLTDHGLTDVSALSTLTRLENLNLSVNRIADIGPLARLSRLDTLWMNHNGVSDLSPLSGLENLETLSLDDNRLADIAPLFGILSLGSLYLSWNEIEDITPLAPLRDLAVLRMYSNRVADISPLAALTKLRVLSVSRNGISDASAVSEMTDLWFLGLSANAITDISPLAKLTNLSWLWLGENSISDVTPLSGMLGLTRLHLESNAITDISPLAEFTNLEILTLEDNAIADIGPLAGLSELTELVLARNKIADIAVLRDLVDIERLDLSGNEVVDITALEFLTELMELNLSYNQIADISPLSANEGLGDGDSIDLRGNPLSDDSLETIVPLLAGRGAQVQSPIRRGEHHLLHDDVVVVLRVAEDVAAETVFTGLPLRDYAAEFYSSFGDEFDFLMFFSNLDDISDHENARYYGLYQGVRNDAEGTGRSRYYDSRYGSRERLKGVIHFPYNRALMNGPSLHEILHAWANFTLPTAVGGHWGFSSANGQLGGFDLADLEDLGGGRYTAGRFGTFANGGNGPPYSPIELYFAGYLPPEEIPDLWVAEDGRWATGEDGTPARTDAGSSIFEAAEVRTYTINDIVERAGPRVPPTGEAQWHFRAALVLLTDDDHPAKPDQLEMLSEHAAWFSRRGSGNRSWVHNFHEATRGHGSITLDGLAATRKPIPGAATGLPLSYGAVPPAHASLIDGTCVSVGPERLREALRATLRGTASEWDVAAGPEARWP